MKNVFVMSAILLGAASAQAEDCTQPDQVVYCGEVGTGKVYDWDSRALLAAAAANIKDFAELTANGREIQKAKVEILPSTNPKKYSDITQYTLIAGHPVPWTGGPVHDIAVLTLRSYFDKRIMDDTPTIWESSGVQYSK